MLDPALDAPSTQKVQALVDSIGRVVLGKPDAIRLLAVGLLSGGHVLIEDKPGVGKTTLARALARSVSGEFCRIQFTPDLLPSDITGISVYDRAKEEFTFKAGPIFANIVLADEINRATPRTQSALLEAMNVFQVTVDGTTHDLPKPFLVIATQNSLEYLGTYPLPEAQLDRFLLRLELGYPEPEDEKLILRARQERDPLDDMTSILTESEVCALQAEVKNVRMSDEVLDYLQEIITSSREHKGLAAGASPRAGLGLFRACQASALLDGRMFVTPDDVKRLAVPALAHRVLLKGEMRATGTASRTGEIVQEIVEGVQPPL